MHKSELLCVCFIFLYTLAVFPSSTKKNASLFYLCSCLCQRGLFTGKSSALVSFTGEVDRNSGQDVTVYSQCCISKPLFLFQVLSKTFVLYSSLIITCNSCSSPGKASTPLYWRLKSLLQQTHCCVSFFLSLSLLTHRLLCPLLLKPYLVRKQAAALVPMLGTQSPLAQHVVSGDLNRLGEPAVEQRVVQREWLWQT